MNKDRVSMGCAAVKAVVASALVLGTMSAVMAAPMSVTPIRGKFCSAAGPRGWMVTGENPQRSAFGADVMSPDGMASAGFAVFAAGTVTGLPQTSDPHRAVTFWISGGAAGTRFGRPTQLAPNIFLIEYMRGAYHGVGFYEVFSYPNRSWAIVLRTANTQANAWRQRAGEAAAVARSLHCNVPAVPAAPDPPSLNSGGQKKKAANDEENTYYNQWLDKEYYHNSRTGENFWVSPSTDYRQTGPEGPGYYAQHGNEIIKLDPGYSR